MGPVSAPSCENLWAILGPAPRRAFVTGLATTVRQPSQITEPNQAQDAPRDQRHARLDQCIGWASSGAGLGNHCVALCALTPMVAVGLGALTAQPLK